MKALDTNILVRFLVRDDSSMAARVDQLLNAANTKGNSFLVSFPVVLELLWVLKSGYKLSRPDILDAVEKLSLMPVLTFEPTCPVHKLVAIGRNSNFDLADILIGLSAKQQGCETTLTLDRKSAQSELFEEIP
jgi:predicted nucleic-acid-binding protein